MITVSCPTVQLLPHWCCERFVPIGHLLPSSNFANDLFNAWSHVIIAEMAALWPLCEPQMKCRDYMWAPFEMDLTSLQEH